MLIMMNRNGRGFLDNISLNNYTESNTIAQIDLIGKIEFETIQIEK